MSSPEANLNGSDGQSQKPLQSEVKKRKRGATRLSCAECRRLKLRCDRAIPCGSCVKRGCAAICPDGSLTTGKGNRATRFVLASTQDLHEKIAELSNRVRDLEEALRVSHAIHSQDTHPLLSEDLLRIKAPLQRENLSSANGNPDEPGSDIVDSFGSLSISDTGRTTYFGQATSSWYFLQNEGQQEADREQRLAQLVKLLSPEILAMADLFPIASNITATEQLDVARLDKLQRLYWCLPEIAEAADLRHIYFQHAAWMYNIVSYEQFNDNVFRQFYAPVSGMLDDHLVAHQLALLFMVLAIGSLMDTKREAYNIDAEKYHQLARAALLMNPIFEEPTIYAVQVLYLMAFYLFLSERHGSGVGSRWALMGLAVRLGISMGLHRDARRWNVEASEIQRRRQTFWELYVYDMWQCYTMGRPPFFSLAHIDCKKPHETMEVTGDETFHAWKHRYTSECMHQVYDQAFGAKTPTYSTILQLDRKLRGFHVPPILQIAGFGSVDNRAGSYDSVPLILQRHLVLCIRETNLLYMHRGFFARAVSDHPKDPLGSPYGSSFIAAYRSAGSLVALVRNIHSQLKELTERMWFFWTHLFSCSIILGSIVTRCPSMSLAPSALVQLDAACDLFSKTAHLFHAQKVLAIMLNLREKAHASLAQFRATPPSRQGTLSEPTSPQDDNDELSVLGGRTRLVAQKEKSVSPVLGNFSPTSANPIVPFPIKQDIDAETHPAVLEYLSSFTSHSHVQQQPQPSIQTAFNPSAFSDMTPMPVSASTSSSSFASSSMQYGAQQSMSPLDMNSSVLLQQQQQHQHQQQQQLPQYFPVFDYGFTGSSDGFANMMNEPAAEMNGGGGRYSPAEGTMQNAWQDFVAQIGHMQ